MHLILFIVSVFSLSYLKLTSHKLLFIIYCVGLFFVLLEINLPLIIVHYLFFPELFFLWDFCLSLSRSISLIIIIIGQISFSVPTLCLCICDVFSCFLECWWENTRGCFYPVITLITYNKFLYNVIAHFTTIVSMRFTLVTWSLGQ